MSNIVTKIAHYLAKNKKFAVVGVVAIVILVLMLTGGNEKTQQHKDSKGQEQASGKGVVTKDEGAAGEVRALQQEMAKMKQEREAEKKALEAKKLTETQQPLPSFKLDQPGGKKHPAASLFQTAPQPVPQAAAAPLPPPPPPPPLPRLQKKEFLPDDPKISDKSAVKESGRTVTLPASSFVEVKLLTGAYATESEAMPVTGLVERAFVGPNRSSVPLKGCQIIGKAKAKIGFEIAVIQAVKLVCVWPDGSVLDEPINGYFTSKPGVNGVPGKLISQDGKFFSTMGVSSFLEGVTQGLARAQETTEMATSPYGVGVATNISGSTAKYGLYKGAEAFSGVTKQFFAKQMEKIEPAVLIEPGSSVYVFLIDSVALKGGNFDKPYAYYDSTNLSSLK